MNLEGRVINALCKNGDIATLLQTNVDPLFTSHGDVWEYVKEHYHKYRVVPSVDEVTIKFNDFEEATISAPTQFYLDDLRNDYVKANMRNMFIDKMARLKDTNGEVVMTEVQAELRALERMTANTRDLDLTDFEQAEKMMAQRTTDALANGGTLGIRTGFSSIDSVYPTGMAPGHLIVCIGWPGRGKTWFTAYMAVKAWEQGYKPMIISLEMSPETMRDRIYTVMGDGYFKNSDLARGDVNMDNFHTWGTNKFNGKAGFVLVSSQGAGAVTADTIQAKIDQHKPNLVILDYHQLFEDRRGAKSTTEQNKNISRDFKLLAVNNGIPIIDITAATMDDVSDQEKAPMLSQVAWSKAIEYDADLALAVHKMPDSSLIDIISRKNRHGGEFSFTLDWDIDKGIIREL